MIDLAALSPFSRLPLSLPPSPDGALTPAPVELLLESNAHAAGGGSGPLSPEVAARSLGWAAEEPDGDPLVIYSPAAWLRQPLRNTATHAVTVWLQIDWWWLPKAEVQVLGGLDGSGPALSPLMRAGSMVPMSQRPLRATAPTFPITLQSGQEALVMIRTEGAFWYHDRLALVDPAVESTTQLKRTVLVAFGAGLSLMLAGLALLKRSRLGLVMGAWVLITALAEVIYQGQLSALPWLDDWPINANALSSSAGLLAHTAQAVMAFFVLGLADQVWWRRTLSLLVVGFVGVAASMWLVETSDLWMLERCTYAVHATGWVSIALALRRGLKPEDRAVAAVLVLMYLNWWVSTAVSYGLWDLFVDHPEVRISIKAVLVALLLGADHRRDRMKIERLQAAVLDVERRQSAELERQVAQRTLELRQALADANHASQAKSQFISSMSHELRTPMNAILGFSQILSEDEHLDPQSRASAADVQKAGRHLLVLIDDLLDLSKVELDRVDLRIDDVAVWPLVRSCRDLLAARYAQRGVALEFSGLEDVVVRADETRLRQVLINLMDNASKYNRPQGWVRVEAQTAAQGGWRLTVADGGLGVSTEAQARLFQPFERGDARYGAVEGTGIGLALSKRLTEAMGGRMGLVSEVGAGSTFWVELPASERADSAVQHSSPTALPEPVNEPLSRRHCVLYVDDNPINLRLMARMLEQEKDFEVITCREARYVLNLALERVPSVILMDINMPEMSGYELLALIRAQPTLADVPVLAVSADAMTEDVERGRAAGFNDYVSKPLEAARFKATLRRTLRAVEARRAVSA